jgi:hypothetical protein
MVECGVGTKNDSDCVYGFFIDAVVFCDHVT